MKIKVKTKVIKEMMLRKFLTQRGLGRLSGVSSPMVTQILNGTRNPGPVIAKKILDALGVEFDEIFFIVDDDKCNQDESA